MPLCRLNSSGCRRAIAKPSINSRSFATFESAGATQMSIHGAVDQPSASGRLAKKILVVSFSQSGQLDRIVAALLAPLRTQATITEEKLAPSRLLPFPWPLHQFLDVFPEAFEGTPCALESLQSAVSARYVLIILAY